jgi:hypothetical protein
MKKYIELFKPVIHMIGIFSTLWLLKISNIEKTPTNLSVQKTDSLRVTLFQNTQNNPQLRISKFVKRTNKYL